MTIKGIAVAAMSSGQRSVKFQLDIADIAIKRETGKEIEAMIDARETYLSVSTSAIQTVMAIKAQNV
jgi:hypothetical protein